LGELWSLFTNVGLKNLRGMHTLRMVIKISLPRQSLSSSTLCLLEQWAQKKKEGKEA